MVSVGVSLATFYLWPKFESWVAHQYLYALRDSAHLDCDKPVDLPDFAQSLQKDVELEKRIRDAILQQMQISTEEAHILQGPDGVRIMFEWLDVKQSGLLHVEDFERLARLQVMSSPLIYSLESILTGTAGISGAQAGLTCGMHPSICCCCGVSIAFGGVLRDWMCRRDVAMGTSSFALASGLSATVYVALRRLVVYGFNIPLVFRVLLSVGAAGGQRAYCWFFLEPGTHFLAKMANYHPAEAGRRIRTRSLLQGRTGALDEQEGHSASK